MNEDYDGVTPPRADTATGLNRPNNLSDRVRSLRLPDRAGGRGGGGSKLPWVLVVVLLLTTTAFGFKAFGPALSLTLPTDTAKAGEVAPVSGDVADSGEVVLEAKGYIIPAHQIQVSPKVAGMIEWLHANFEEGRRFKEGDVLARLEAIDYQADVDRSRGFLTAAKQRLEELEQGWPLERHQAEAKLASARSNMDYRRRERDRVQRTGGGDQRKDRDESESLYEQAVRSHDEASKGVDLLAEKGPRLSRIAASRAEVKQAEAELSKSEWRLKNCEIIAPVTGTILTKKAERGNLVNPVAFNVSASLCEMADLRDLEVDLSIQERNIANVVVGQECLVMPEAFQKNEVFLKKHPGGYKGFVHRLMPIADRAKGAIPVRVKLQPGEIPAEEEGVYLKPDMGVIVSFKKPK